MPIRGELSLKGELILRQLRQEVEAERIASHMAIDDDAPRPPEVNPLHSAQSRRTSGVAL